jgi:probable HAF family extracellular repeat protein
MLPSGKHSAAIQINHAAQIIGVSDSADGLGHAVLWENGKLFDLNQLAKSHLPKNTVLLFGDAISDDGKIVCLAVNAETQQRSLLLLIPHYSTTTALTSAKNPAVDGQVVTLIASVQASGGSAVTGVVTFNDGTKRLGSASLNSSQKAVFLTSTLSEGAHRITAVYAESASDLSSASAVLTERIEPATH